MANKHSPYFNYMIQVKTENGNTESGTQTSYSNIKLMDAESSYFITADEIVRCLCETLCKESTQSTELEAENIIIASPEDLRKIASTVEK